MKRNTWIWKGITGAVLVVAGMAASAQGPEGFGNGFGGHRPPMERAMGPLGEHGRWWNNPEVAEKLKLTDDQRKAMDQILLQHRETLIDLHANLDKAEVAMEPLMHADQPDEGKILAQIDKVAQARAELEKANARFLLALRAKLTPDQWKQLQTLRSERFDRHEMRRDMHPGPGQAPPPPPPGGPQGALHLPAVPDAGPETMNGPSGAVE